jgi:hypothetical protein
MQRVKDEGWKRFFYNLPFTIYTLPFILPNA